MGWPCAQADAAALRVPAMRIVNVMRFLAVVTILGTAIVEPMGWAAFRV
jgi:hypothetical protein